MNKLPSPIYKRVLVFSSAVLFLILLIDGFIFYTNLEKEKTQTTLEALKDHKILTHEIHTLLHGVQDDFRFFEKKALDIIQKSDKRKTSDNVNSLLEFLETHSGYFKVRLTSAGGQELFKIVQDPKRSVYYQSFQLFNLQNQAFFQDLNKVQGTDYYFSSIEPNIINGVMEVPMRPTVRVSKRVHLKNGESGLLILNIDGMRILDLFSTSEQSKYYFNEQSLIDYEGLYIATIPKKGNSLFALFKTSFKKKFPKIYNDLKKQKNIQGSFDSSGELVVFSQLSLPKTTENWILVTKFDEKFLFSKVFKNFLGWVFVETFFLVLFILWFWKDEVKRHRDQVVNVLLKERSEFIQNVSHQLKTPLAIMINSLEKNVPGQSDWIEVKKEMHHLIKVVEDMLLLAQVDAIQNLPLKKENILEIITEAVGMTGPKAKERGVSIRLNVDEDLLKSHNLLEFPMMGELLKSAFLNLIDNAIDFSPNDGLVHINLSFKNEHITIQIKDNGPGIPEEFHSKLFGRFSRFEKSQRKGTGLGLSITKKIIDLHKGTIRLVDFKGGTTFEVEL